MLRLSVFMTAQQAIDLSNGLPHTAGDRKDYVERVKLAYAACGVPWTPTFVCIAATAQRQAGQAASAGAYGTERVPLRASVIDDIVIATANDLQNAAASRPPRPLHRLDGGRDERAALLSKLADASDPNLYAECRIHRKLTKEDVNWEEYGVTPKDLLLRTLFDK